MLLISAQLSSLIKIENAKLSEIHFCVPIIDLFKKQLSDRAQNAHVNSHDDKNINRRCFDFNQSRKVEKVSFGQGRRECFSSGSLNR